MGEVCIAEAAAHLSGTAPIFNLSLHGGVTALDHTGDDGMALAGALQIRDHLTDGTAGVQLTQPCRDVGVGVVGRFLLLDIDQHDRHIQIAHCRQHIIRSSVGQQLQNNQINIGSAELIACCHRLLLGRDDTAVNDLNGVGQRLFEGGVLALKLRHQRGELRQISAQRNSKHANAGLGFN